MLSTDAWAAFVVLLFFGILIVLEAGRRFGQRRAARDVEGARAGLGVVDGAIFGLLGLLIAFAFSGAAARFDGRKALIAQEANAVGTAWLRLDLLPRESQPALRELFRQYLEARIAGYRKLPDLEAAFAEDQRATALQADIWSKCVPLCQSDAGRPYAVLVLGALNEMFDMATTRNMALRQHPPIIITGMIGLSALLGAAHAGFGMAGSKRRSWLHYLGFAAILSITIYVTIDLEHPRAGLFRVDAADRVLIDLLAGMH